MKTSILLGDDVISIQKAIKIALNHFDVGLDFAVDCASLLDKLKNPYDLVIISSKLPGMEHLEETSILFSQKFHDRLILLKGSFENHTLPCWQEWDHNQTLEKPFSSADVVNIVNRHLAKPLIAKPKEPIEHPLAFTSERKSASSEPNPPAHSSQHSATQWSLEGSIGAQLPPELRDQLPQLLDEKLVKIMEKTVKAYCEEHFKSLAKEVISAEIRRLTQERVNRL